MGIIIEGMDNSGKSTLAAKISDKLKMPIYHPGPAPVTVSAAEVHLQEQKDMSKCFLLFDRVTCMSDAVYNPERLSDLYLSYRKQMSNSNIVIYCRPPVRTIVDFSNHEVKDYDSEEHLKKVIDGMHEYIHRYDAMMNVMPHIKYDWTDDQVNIQDFCNILLKSMVIPGYYQKLQIGYIYDEDTFHV